MNKITTLGEVSDRIDELSKNCYDELVNVKDISFNDINSVNIGSESHPLRNIAQRSIAYRLGIPYQYLAKCSTELQQKNLNYWIKHEKNEQLFFRYDGNDVRSSFTTKYQPVDNFEIIERLDSLGYSPDTEVQCHLDGEFMSLSILDGKSLSIEKDKFRPGIKISNSEVGLASLSIAAYFLRLVCTNGLISATEVGASYRHISNRILNEFPQILNNVSNELSSQFGKFKISMDSVVDNPEETFNNFNRRFQLKKIEEKAIEWAIPYESSDPNTMFNVINTYTKAAQFVGLSANSRHRMEKTGGNILDMVSMN